MYAFFSLSQSKISKVFFVEIDNFVVKATELSENNKPSGLFKDYVYLGKVNKQLSFDNFYGKKIDSLDILNSLDQIKNIEILLGEDNIN